jgi:hypothetical protein
LCDIELAQAIKPVTAVIIPAIAVRMPGRVDHHDLDLGSSAIA